MYILSLQIKSGFPLRMFKNRRVTQKNFKSHINKCEKLKNRCTHSEKLY